MKAWTLRHFMCIYLLMITWRSSCAEQLLIIRTLNVLVDFVPYSLSIKHERFYLPSSRSSLTMASSHSQQSPSHQHQLSW